MTDLDKVMRGIRRAIEQNTIGSPRSVVVSFFTALGVERDIIEKKLVDARFADDKKSVSYTLQVEPIGRMSGTFSTTIAFDEIKLIGEYNADE